MNVPSNINASNHMNVSSNMNVPSNMNAPSNINAWHHMNAPSNVNAWHHMNAPSNVNAWHHMNVPNSMNVLNKPHKMHHGHFKHHPSAPMPTVVCAEPPVNKTMPAMHDPAQKWQKNYNENIVIPHVHHSHTTHFKHTHYTHEHYYPHTESCVETSSCSDVNCTPIPVPPCPPCPPHRIF